MVQLCTALGEVGDGSMHACTPIPPRAHSVDCLNNAFTHVLLQNKLCGSLHSIQYQTAYTFFLLFVTDLLSITYVSVMLTNFIVLTCLPASANCRKHMSEIKEQIIYNFATLFWNISTLLISKPAIKIDNLWILFKVNLTDSFSTLQPWDCYNPGNLTCKQLRTAYSITATTH